MLDLKMLNLLLLQLSMHYRYTCIYSYIYNADIQACNQDFPKGCAKRGVVWALDHQVKRSKQGGGFVNNTSNLSFNFCMVQGNFL